jgi:tetratricopeptide (TPR) repeat protein
MAELVLEFAPDEADAYDLLGVVYQVQGDLEAAEGAFQKALLLNPNMIASRLGLAGLYLEAKPALARQHYLAVLAIDADNTYAKEGLQQLGP